MATSTTDTLELEIDGMTCAACASTIERRLNAIDGVDATVNFALRQAAVAYDADATDVERIVDAVEQAGYHARPTEAAEGGEAVADDARAEMRRRLVAAVLLGVPVVLVSMVPALQFGGWQWLALALATPVVWWSGWPIHSSAWRGVRHRAIGMDVLVSLGSLTAWVWSVVAIVVFGAGADGESMGFELVQDRSSATSHAYLEVAVAIVMFVLAGRYAEERSRREAGAAINALLDLGAREAVVVDDDGVERSVPVERLRVGDRFVVRHGERVATDGVVVEGSSTIDRSMLTGESVPQPVGEGDPVVGATIGLGGRVVVRATRIGADTVLAHVVRLVREAQAGKAPVQRLVDRVSSVFVPVVVVLALLTLAGWLLAGADASFALSAAVAVLIIACPCALGLATPTALLVGTGRGARMGILLRGPEALEAARRLDVVVLDKTGTITTGRMGVEGVVPAAGVDPDRALIVAGSLEGGSQHPIARAIAAAARERGELSVVSRFRSRDGLGVVGSVDGADAAVGSEALLREQGIEVPDELGAAAERGRAQGLTCVLVAWDGAARAVVQVADSVRPTSSTAVADLRDLGLRVILLTGDDEVVARAVAARVGIDEVIAGVLPDRKRDVVRDLQTAGHRVAMVGDGVNDAPALAQADVGMAVGGGADAAIEASDITLMRDDPRAIATAIRLSHRTLATIRTNLFWAFAYNVAAIPLAASGYLNPVIASAAMACSSLLVVANSLRLRRVRFGS